MAERIYLSKSTDHSEEPANSNGVHLPDDREELAAQAKLIHAIQLKSDSNSSEEKRGSEEPEAIKQKFGAALHTDFSTVRFHPESSRATQLEALAVTQGKDIDFAPGQFQPATSSGLELIGHELVHVKQQEEGRVAPTTEVAGMAVNNQPELEQEADILGAKAAHSSERMHLYTDVADHRPEEAAQARMAEEWQNQSSPLVEVVQRKPEVRQLGKGKSTGRKRRERKERREELERSRLVRGAKLTDEPGEEEAFHEFGDEHRAPEVDPDRDDAAGQAGVYLGGHRPDDVEIILRFRQLYNNFDDVVWHIQQEGLTEEVAKKWDLNSHHQFIAEIKAENKKYKNFFRDLKHTQEEIENEEIAFEEFVDERALELRRLSHSINSYLVAKYGDYWNRAIAKEGWREAWHKKVLEVNVLLDKEWKLAKPEIEAWVAKQGYRGRGDWVGDVTYIGSLAKGYKGPPKQHVRFDPSSFDVDANLEAPPLADYAMKVKHLFPDRGRIFGKLAEIPPLTKFCDRVEAALAKHIEGYSSSADDRFDVAIIAADTLQQQAYDGYVMRLYEARTGLEEDEYEEMLTELEGKHLLKKTVGGNATLKEDLTPGEEGKLEAILQNYGM